VVAASGDKGAASDLHFGSAIPVKEVSLPASDPLVLAAGGTSLTADRATGAYIGETAWNTLPAPPSPGDSVEVGVIDRGPGIPPQDRDAVFAAFQRRDDHATSTGGGLGLGLAIARGFVEAMHGSLTLDDTPAGGLTAVVALPKAPGSAQPTDAASALGQLSP
jgi:signal transduction histidine kinase